MLRNPDSIPAGDTVVKDPVMEPFFISRSQTGGYTVYENVIKGANDTKYIKTISYPANFNNALKTVMREKLNAGPQKNFDTLKEYINRWESIKEEMKSITSIE